MTTEYEIRKRCRPDQMALIEKAAAFDGKSVGTFALNAALQLARQALMEKWAFEKAEAEASVGLNRERKESALQEAS